MASAIKLGWRDAQRIFRGLVRLQDEGWGWLDSRRLAAAQAGISEQQILEIERAGILANWPPLDGRCP